MEVILLLPPFHFYVFKDNQNHYFKNPHMWSGIKAYYLNKYTLFKRCMLEDDSDLILTQYKG